MLRRRNKKNSSDLKRKGRHVRKKNVKSMRSI
jgi:hypothetical protein